jgi:hypothetical protein
MSKLVSHLELFLGNVVHAWDQVPGLAGSGVQIAQHDSVDRGAGLVLSTLGLSRYALRSASSGKIIHHELLFFANRPDEPRNLPAVLSQIVELTIKGSRAILKGDIIGPAGPLLTGSRMEALFATLPILLPPEFASAEDDDGRGVAMVWLLPITRKEAIWAQTHGWEAFEEELDRETPDGLDWFREEMTLS